MGELRGLEPTKVMSPCWDSDQHNDPNEKHEFNLRHVQTFNKLFTCDISDILGVCDLTVQCATSE